MLNSSFKQIEELVHLHCPNWNLLPRTSFSM